MYKELGLIEFSQKFHSGQNFGSNMYRIDILKEAIDWPDAKDVAWRVHFDAQETLREGHGAKMEILEELMCWVASGCG